jgi:hypothetical protein
MNLSTLKTKLSVLTGTSIGQVIFDWKIYRLQVEKTYPVILWALDNTEFVKDSRTGITQITKTITLPLFILKNFNVDDDKIAVWDTLEGYLDAYLNKMDATANIQVMNINEIKGEYIPEGVMQNNEIGILYKDVQLKITC